MLFICLFLLCFIEFLFFEVHRKLHFERKVGVTGDAALQSIADKVSYSLCPLSLCVCNVHAMDLLGDGETEIALFR